MRLSLPSWLLPVSSIWPPALPRQVVALSVIVAHWLQVHPFAVSNHGSIGLLSYPVLPSQATSLQAIFLHRFCVTVVVGDQFLTCQYIVCTQTHGIGFLAVRAFTILLLLIGFPSLSCYYWYDRSMNVRCVLIHVQNYRNGILLAEGVLQPLQVVITPFIHLVPFLSFYAVFPEILCKFAYLKVQTIWKYKPTTSDASR